MGIPVRVCNTNGDVIGAKLLDKADAQKIINVNAARDRRYGTPSVTYLSCKNTVVMELNHILNQIIFSDISCTVQDNIEKFHTHGAELTYDYLTRLRGQLGRHLHEGPEGSLL